MKLLLGCTRSRKLLRRMRALGWGRIYTVCVPRVLAYPSEPWALDNGAFPAWKKGEPPWNVHQLAAFYLAVSQVERRVRQRQLPWPLFVTLPDKVADPNSLRFSIDWYNRFGRDFDRRMPWYLVLQDGMRERELGRLLTRTCGVIKGLFLGGSNDFKLTAPAWCRFAREHGVHFHFARVSTIKRLQQAYEMGADSADTSQPLWEMKAFDKYEQAWRELERQHRGRRRPSCGPRLQTPLRARALRARRDYDPFQDDELFAIIEELAGDAEPTEDVVVMGLRILAARRLDRGDAMAARELRREAERLDAPRRRWTVANDR